MRAVAETLSTCRIWTRQQDRPDRQDVKHCTREKFQGKIDFKEYEFWGIRIMIPRYYLHGTQKQEEYDNKKRRAVETQFQKCGITCLEENPAIVCAVPIIKDQMLPAIIDGHHKSRYSTNFGIHLVPSLVFSPDALTEIYRREGVEPSDKAVLIEKIQQNVAEAIDSFKHMPDYKQPRLIPKVTKPSDLLKYFPAF